MTTPEKRSQRGQLHEPVGDWQGLASGALELRGLHVSNRKVLDAGIDVQQDVEVRGVHADEGAQVKGLLAAPVAERAEAEWRCGIVDHMWGCREAWRTEHAGHAGARAWWETGRWARAGWVGLGAGCGQCEGRISVEAVGTSVRTGVCKVLCILAFGLTQEAVVGDAAFEDDEPSGDTMGTLDELTVDVPARRRPCHVL